MVTDISFFLKSYHGKTGYDVRKYLRFTDEDVRRATRAAARGCGLWVINTGILTTISFHLELLEFGMLSLTTLSCHSSLFQKI